MSEIIIWSWLIITIKHMKTKICNCKCGCDYKLDGYKENEMICGACLDKCSMTYDNEKLDKYGYTDLDIIEIVENGDLGEWREEEQIYIQEQYKLIKTREFIIECMDYWKEKDKDGFQALTDTEVYLLERARKLSGDKIKI